MKSEKMVEFSYRCKCGAVVTGWAARDVTPEEMAALKERDCDACLLKKLLEEELETIDDEICT